MRQAVRELLESSDRQEECPGPATCPRYKKKGFCPDYCPSQNTAEADPVYLMRYQRASETLLELEYLGLSYDDLEWQEIPDLKILITQRNIFLNKKAKRGNPPQSPFKKGGGNHGRT